MEYTNNPINIGFVTEGIMGRGNVERRNGRFVMKNQFLFHDDFTKGKTDIVIKSEVISRITQYRNAKNNNKFLKNVRPVFIPIFKFLIEIFTFLFKKVTPTEDISIERCCSGDLVLVKSRSFYNELSNDINDHARSSKKSEVPGKAIGFFLNDILYNRSDGDNTVNPNQEDSIREEVEREGGTRFWSLSSEPIPCSEVKEPIFDRQKYKDYVSIGVIDFGFEDPHGDFIKQIIDKRVRGKKVKVVDYNLVRTTRYASVYAICCQISRGIKEDIDILNISLGYYTEERKPNQVLQDHVKRASDKDIIMICSAGNGASNNTVNPHWPSDFTAFSKWAVASVGSCQIKEESQSTYLREDYSNYGNLVSGYERGSFIVDARGFTQINYILRQTNGSVGGMPQQTLDNFRIKGTSYTAAQTSAEVALNLLGSVTSIDRQNFKNSLLTSGILRSI